MQHHIMYLLLFADKVKTIIAACAASMFTQCHAMHVDSEATVLLSVTAVVLSLSGVVLVIISYTVSPCKRGQFCHKVKKTPCFPYKRNCSSPTGTILPEYSNSI